MDYTYCVFLFALKVLNSFKGRLQSHIKFYPNLDKKTFSFSYLPYAVELDMSVNQ